MKAIAISPFYDKFIAFLGLSRVLQACLSIAEPAFVALIALGTLPSPLVTAFATSVALAGYLAVFAANDLFDADLDRKRFQHLRSYDGFDIDSAAIRHPLAQGRLTLPQGVIWVTLLSAYAITGSYSLNPVSTVLFLTAAVLEVGYCRLAKVSAWKFIPSGLMVAVGALAGWFAVAPEPILIELAILFVWMYAWEIGGRNIVNDWADVEEDLRLGIKTVPVVYGYRIASLLILCHLVVTVVASLALGVVAQLSWLYLFISAAAGWYFLLGPGLRLMREQKPEVALFLFNRASLYPPAMLVGLVSSLYLRF